MPQTKKSRRGGGHRPPTSLNQKTLNELREDSDKGMTESFLLRKYHIGKKRLLRILETGNPKPGKEETRGKRIQAIIDETIGRIQSVLDVGAHIESIGVMWNADEKRYESSINLTTTTTIDLK